MDCGEVADNGGFWRCPQTKSSEGCAWICFFFFFPFIGEMAQKGIVESKKLILVNYYVGV